jgi:hypothetical protein
MNYIVEHSYHRRITHIYIIGEFAEKLELCGSIKRKTLINCTKNRERDH